MDYYPLLQPMRQFFESGATRSFDFRKQQLQQLKEAIVSRNHEIEEALYKDLHKSAAEAWATETGLVLAEINTLLKNLRNWIAPQKVPTNAVNLPSSSRIYNDPLGMVLIIAPWNYPFQLMLLPLAGAIAAGNCVVLKPSELAPATSALILSMISDLYPSKYVRVIEGDGAAVIPGMMDGFRFDHVLYTGSIRVGKIIYQLAAKDLVPVTLELGGKSPAVVEADANIEVAARRIALGKFINAGQTCIAPDYVLIHESRQVEFVDQMRKTIKQFYSEDPKSSDDYGRMINRKRFEAILKYMNNGTIAVGGKSDAEALYIEPTILTGVSLDSPVMHDEIFGPILPVIPFKTREEAKNVIQQNPNPLAFYLFTEDAELKKQWMESTSFGGGCVNNTAWQFANHYLPFGGVGNSGFGAYHGRSSFDTFSRKKSVLESPTWLDPSLRYPPFKGKMKLLKWVIGR